MQRLLHKTHMQPQHRKMRILHKTQMHNKRNPKNGGKHPMTNETLADKIKPIITEQIDKQPAPTKATITRVYQDGHVDIETIYGKLTYIQTIIDHELNDETILIFLDNDYNKRIVI